VIYSAGIYRIGNDGTYKWFYTLDPNSASKLNKCYGIVYDTVSQLITVLIQSTSDYLSYSSNTDVSLVVLDKSGVVKNGNMITFKYDI
jgi:hypothetical protein